MLRGVDPLLRIFPQHGQGLGGSSSSSEAIRIMRAGPAPVLTPATPAVVLHCASILRRRQQQRSFVGKQLKILMLEDSAPDAELEWREIKRAGIDAP